MWKMAGEEGLEPPTVGFGDRCSTNWNYSPVVETHYTEAMVKVKPFIRRGGSFAAKLADLRHFTFSRSSPWSINSL